MPKLTEMQLLARDAKRNLADELAESLKDLKAGKVGRVTVINREGKLVESAIAKVRIRTGLSQAKFATLLGVSVRTLQQWEQGRREPTGAAKTLLRIAEKQPDVLIEAAR